MMDRLKISVSRPGRDEFFNAIKAELHAEEKFKKEHPIKIFIEKYIFMGMIKWER